MDVVFLSVIVGAIGIVVPVGALTPPAQWSSSVCTSLSDWSDALPTAPNDAPDLPAKTVKKALVDFFGQAADATVGLLADLKSAGSPEVAHGKAIAKAFRRGIMRAARIFDGAEGDARRLPTASRRKFNARRMGIIRRIDDVGTEIERAFDAARSRYDVPALDATFDRAEACRSLSS